MTGRTAGRIAIGALWMALVPGVAQAGDFTVDTGTDGVDANVGDGTCAQAGGGCTLRAAIQEADADAGPSTVVLPAGRYRLSIPPTTEAGSLADMDPANGDLDISGNLILRGAGAGRTIVDGGGVDRVFATSSLANARFSDMTITGGDSTAGGSQEIDLGGGILNLGSILLDRIELAGNKADGGGGMFSIPGTLPVIRDTLITGNTAYEGGGLRIDHGGTIVNTTITHNTLLAVPTSDIATKPVTVVSPAVAEITGYGGGLDHRGGADLTIVNSTITDNHAVKGGGGLGAGQGYAPVSSALPLGRMILHNTIVAGNTSDAGPANCRTNQVVIESRGHNLAGDGSCFLTAPGDHPDTDPRLAPLADNGGPTRTLALLAGSPAIDAGADCPATDQRGTARPQGAACDIGAFEAVPVAAPTACRRTVRLPRRLRARARRFDVLAGRRVLRRRLRPRRRVVVRRAHVTLRIHTRRGHVIRIRVRARCHPA